MGFTCQTQLDSMSMQLDISVNQKDIRIKELKEKALKKLEPYCLFIDEKLESCRSYSSKDLESVSRRLVPLIVPHSREFSLLLVPEEKANCILLLRSQNRKNPLLTGFSYEVSDDIDIAFMGEDRKLLPNKSSENLKTSYFYWCKKIQLLEHWQPIELVYMQNVFKCCKEIIEKDVVKTDHKEWIRIGDISVESFISHCCHLLRTESLMTKKDYSNLLIHYLYFIDTYLKSASFDPKYKHVLEQIAYVFQNIIKNYDDYLKEEYYYDTLELISESKAYEKFRNLQITQYRDLIKDIHFLQDSFTEVVNNIMCNNAEDIYAIDAELYSIRLCELIKIGNTQQDLDFLQRQLSLLRNHQTRLLEQERIRALELESVVVISPPRPNKQRPFLNSLIDQIEKAISIIQAKIIFSYDLDFGSVCLAQTMSNYSISTENMQRFIQACNDAKSVAVLKLLKNFDYERIKQIYDTKLPLKKDLLELHQRINGYENIDTLVECSNSKWQLTEIGKQVWTNLIDLGNREQYYDKEDNHIIDEIKKNPIIQDLIKCRYFLYHIISYPNYRLFNDIEVITDKHACIVLLKSKRIIDIPSGISKQISEITAGPDSVSPKPSKKVDIIKEEKKPNYSFSKKQIFFCASLLVVFLEFIHHKLSPQTSVYEYLSQLLSSLL